MAHSGNQRLPKRWIVLARHIEANNYRFGAEIGVERGNNARNLLKRLPDLRLVGIDNYCDGYPTDGPPYIRSPEKAKEHERHMINVMSQFGSRFSFLKMDATEAAHLFDDGELDFVFIDGDHSYDGCMSDIETFYPKVRKGGMIAGHDFQDKFPGVKKAVKEAFEKFTVETDSVWLTFKS